MGVVFSGQLIFKLESWLGIQVKVVTGFGKRADLGKGRIWEKGPYRANIDFSV